MGDEWRGRKEEGGRKETFLAGAETQETHCGRRLQGVQVKIDVSPNGAVTDNRPSVFLPTLPVMESQEKNSQRVLENGKCWNFFFLIPAVRLDFILILGGGLQVPLPWCLQREVSRIPVCFCVLPHFQWPKTCYLSWTVQKCFQTQALKVNMKVNSVLMRSSWQAAPTGYDGSWL